MNSEVSKAMITERKEAARRAGEQTRALSEAREAARVKRAVIVRPRAVIARGMRALRRAPAQ
jgi:hypothetical protein